MRSMPVSVAAAGGAGQASVPPTASTVRAQISRDIGSVYRAAGAEHGSAPATRSRGPVSGAQLQRRPCADGVSMTWGGGACGLVGPVGLPAGAGDDDGRGGTGIRAPPVGASPRRSAGPATWSAVTAGCTVVAGPVVVRGAGDGDSCRMGWRGAAGAPPPAPAGGRVGWGAGG